MCEPDEAFQCEGVPYDCGGGGWPCGLPASWIDANGCLRDACADDGSCPEGFVCFDPREQCGVCWAPRPTCSVMMAGDEEVCVCGQDGACEGTVCVAVEEWEAVEDPCAPFEG